MKIDVLPLGYIGANCYMISDDETAIVIDPGKKSDKVSSFLKENMDKQRAILLTHSHFDHICGALELRNETNTNIIICEKDAEGLFNTEISLSDYFRAHQTPFYADKTVKDDEIITVGTMSIKCIHTPGHTPGSMCYLIDDNLFAGDTLFNGSIGRTDFPRSNPSDMAKSLLRLTKLDGNVKVYPGHGESTTIGNEVLNNPFLNSNDLGEI